MNNRPVAVLDSGIGGLPYLSWIQEHLPQESLLYLADRKNFPYGTKTPDQVRALGRTLVASLVEREDPKVLVVACNTLTVQALDLLRAEFPLPIIGVVPAVKTAAEVTANGHIGVLATKSTIESPYLTKLIDDFCDGTEVLKLAASDIVDHVENDYLNPNLAERNRILTQWAEELRAQDVDTLVLGCTHFLHVSADFRRILGPGVRIVDSRDGVGRQTRKVLQEKNLLSREKSQPDRFFFTADRSGGPENLGADESKYRVFADRFHLAYGGPWFL